MPNKFVVPQFIENEDRILGPITVRQFLILLVDVFIVFIEYSILQFLYFIIVALISTVIALAFAFVKINGQAFHIFFVNFLQSNIRPSLRIWDKQPSDMELREGIKSQEKPVATVVAGKPRPASSHLHDLALTVNTGGVYKADEE